jgi:heat shock protein HslJ
MNRMVFATIMLFALLFAGCAGIFPQEPVACTMEAKICPDGSAVGRTGPNCEFAPCPGEVPGCGTCPMLVQPGPNFCSEGVIVAGIVNECGCRGPPSCACTEEAKVCPDGSAVGRTGPNCEFAPCPGEGSTQEEYLLEHKWKLLKIDNEVVEDSRVYIQFDEEKGTFGGNAGCNSMAGGYTLNGDQIDFGQTAITLMYCEDAADLEGKVLAKIGGGPYKWELADQALNFYKGDELVMIWGVDTE